MAQKAAHLTSFSQVKPSIFEVIAQEYLAELLHPSFKIIAQFLGSSNPQRFQWLIEWQEEAFLVINGLLQLHYLNVKGGSFSECFYGLRRVVGDGHSGHLTRSLKAWSLLCLVVLPYIARKVELNTANLQGSRREQSLEQCNKLLYAGWRMVSLVQYLYYLTGQAMAHSPLLSLANLSLQYCPEEPYRPFSWTEFLSPGAFSRLVSDGLTQGLELGAFFLQCLQWWHSDENGHSKADSSEIPPPPPLMLGVERSSQCMCPVCQEPCKIDTALLTSGYVFCYRCIRETVVAKQRCPVTGLPTSLDELVRIYPSR